MKARLVVLLAYAVIAVGACTDSATDLRDPEPQPQPQAAVDSVIASDVIIDPPVSGSIRTHGSAAAVSFVSLPQGTRPLARSVTIRNVTAGGPATAAITVFAGGFDPVAISASPNDELELAFADSVGAITLVKTTVPIKRPPRIVRTNPPKGRSDVAMRIIPAVIFSEPIDAQSLTGAVLLRSGGTAIAARVEVAAGAPWVVDIVPETPLLPLTTYEVVVTPGVRDLEGDPFARNETVTFTTGPTLQFTGRLAFVSDREGSTNIYLANGDDSGVGRLTSGDKPSWSPDGRRIVFERGRSSAGGPFPQGAEIRMINVDGTGETRLIAGMDPAWSPDGNRIAYVDSAGISVINVDGTGNTLLIRHDANLRGPQSYYVGAPAWSPDGTRIAFEHSGNEDQVQRLFVMNADGSAPRLLTPSSPTADFAECTPSWSPDGGSIVLWHFQRGIAAIDAAGTGSLRTLASPPFPQVSCYSAPDWSTDGTAVVFAIQQEDVGRVWRSRLYVVNAGGGQLHQLIADVAAPANPSYADRDAVWSRAGR